MQKDNLLESLLMELIRMESHIKLDFILLLHQRQVIMEMEKLFHFVLKESFMKILKQEKK